MAGGQEHDLFFVRRNTNRNEVHYAIRLGADGAPLQHNPVYGYWKMFEKGEDAREPITVFEQLAFGIHSQRIADGMIILKLAALPDREIRIIANADRPSGFSVLMQITGQEAELISFYAHAEPAFLMPKVKYIDIHGTAGGSAVTERILR